MLAVAHEGAVEMGGEEEKEGAFGRGVSGMPEKEAHITFPVMETGAGIVERQPGLGIGEQDIPRKATGVKGFLLKITVQFFIALDLEVQTFPCRGLKTDVVFPHGVEVQLFGGVGDPGGLRQIVGDDEEIFRPMRLGKAQLTEDGSPVEFQDRTLQVVAIAQPRHVDDAMLKDADTGLRMFIGQPVADHLPTTEADVRLMDLQQGVQPLVHLRMDGVIRIDEPDIITGHVVQAGIPCPTLSAILRTVDDLEAGILFRKPVAQQATAVGGAVVDQDDLQLLVGGP